MGFYKKLVHDIIGVDGRKISSSLKSVARSVKQQRKKLRNCDRVRKMKID